MLFLYWHCAYEVQSFLRPVTILKSQGCYRPSPGLVICSSAGCNWLVFINLILCLHRGNLSSVVSYCACFGIKIYPALPG